MKKLLCFTLIAGSTFAALAQEGRIVTPFTPRVMDEQGNKVYVNPQRKVQSAFSITLGYGFQPVTSREYYSNNLFPFHFNNNPGAQADPAEITSTTGAIMVGINWEINSWLELNVPFVYTYNKGIQPYAPSGVNLTYPIHENWLTLMPTLRINWMRNNWLSLYTRAGVGFGLGTRYTDVDADETTKAVFGYQVSPLGVELGTGRVNFFVEGGYGYTGVVTGGLKIKIGNTLANGKTSTGRTVEWYEKYMH